MLTDRAKATPAETALAGKALAEQYNLIDYGNRSAVSILKSLRAADQLLYQAGVEMSRASHSRVYAVDGQLII